MWSLEASIFEMVLMRKHNLCLLDEKRILQYEDHYNQWLLWSINLSSAAVVIGTLMVNLEILNFESLISTTNHLRFNVIYIKPD